MKNKSLILFGLAIVLLFGGALFFQKANIGTQWLWDVSKGGTVLLPLIAVSAIIDSINPCSFSVLLVSIIFLFSIGKERNKIIKYGLIYILGIFAAYFLIGLGLLQALHIFDIPHFMSKLAAGILVLFGLLEIINVAFPKFPIKLGIPHSAHHKMNELVKVATVPAMFGLGMLVGLCEFPCTGGPYLAVLGLLHDTKSYWQGARYLILYNVIFILPLIAILFFASNKLLIEKVQGYHQQNKRTARLVTGVLMILLAFIILYI